MATRGQNNELKSNHEYEKDILSYSLLPLPVISEASISTARCTAASYRFRIADTIPKYQSCGDVMFIVCSQQRSPGASGCFVSVWIDLRETTD